MDIAQKLAELESLHRRAEEGGGPERRKRQHDASKLTARERIHFLLDEGTFEEMDKFVENVSGHLAKQDIVITTAQLFGKSAPRLLNREMVAGMRPGSVIVDLAASTGGNVEGTVAGEEVFMNGVRIVGLTNLPGTVARDASQMYAANVANLLGHL